MSEMILIGCLSLISVLFLGYLQNKKPILQVVLIISLVASSLTLSAPIVSHAAFYPKGTVAATIAKEVDGDSIYVTLNHKTVEIRMLLIDTPETHDPRKPVEPFGPAASAYAKKMLPVGSKVRLQEGLAGHRYDKYHRLLAFIYTSKGSLYNYLVVKQGLARVAYIEPPNTQHLASLESAQSYAKSRKLGIWSRKGYVTASGYNYSTKKTAAAPKSSSSTAHGLSVKRGQNASVSVTAKRGARGTIKVYYKSGISKAKGLEPKIAGSSGKITWTWLVGTATTPGTYRVVIQVGNKTSTQYLRVSK
ncbi:thermonuclease family protein [Sporolactobacillus spathodeae]|uniref:Micrococcal nuclease n=1 Tax=Sporolactobacillus spathodeae TaxID=1465502 RepID=A0ABS2Q7K4_9BACL|nr:thermonuclease family protein [Sporolactobacillus spathodeae]MBM7657771.1 micrococcal nuclease [Sporolactobacillus spathodeae]